MTASVTTVSGPSHRAGRALRATRRVLVGLVILVALAAVALAVLLRPDSEGIDTILGHPVFSVASGSMTPAIDTGDLIVDAHVSASQVSDLRPGQIISFRESASIAGAPIITHRIVARVAGAGQTPVLYRTKGDANNAPDLSLVAPSQIVGIYQLRIPLGAYVISTLHQPLTFVVLVMIPVVYLAEEEIRRRWMLLGAKDAERRRVGEEGEREQR